MAKRKPITEAEKRAVEAGYRAGSIVVDRRFQIMMASANARNKILASALDAMNANAAEANRKIDAENRRVEAVKLRGLVAQKFSYPEEDWE